MIAYGDDDRSLFFVLIIFNDENLLYGLLNEEQQPEQRMPHKTVEDIKIKKKKQTCLI